MSRKFECIKDCSDCCINRQYYPSVEYGKIGVLLLPEEKTRIEKLAAQMGIKVTIVPRLGTGAKSGGKKPSKIIAYQMMGKNQDGSLCPFLDTEGPERSPHGGFRCKIYEDRPLACRAYPVIGSKGRGSAILDDHCKFCTHFSEDSALANGLQNEFEALAKIQKDVVSDGGMVWRYATGIGDEKDEGRMFSPGWIADQQ